MEFTPPHHGERTSIQQGTCKHCNGWVQLDTNPLPNGIDIGGDALALTCCGPTVARARTEFNRTQGVLLDLLERYIPYSRDRARVTEALRQHGGACVQLGYMVQRFVPRHTHDFGPWETASAKYNYLRHGKLLEVQNTVQLRRCRDPNCQKLELQQFE